MNKIKDLLLYSCLFAIIIFEGLSAASCPDPQLIKPCLCDNSNIKCIDVTGVQLKGIFTKLSLKQSNEEEKQFVSLVISGPGCDQLLEHTFANITFENILVRDAPKFSAIHTNAFYNTHQVLNGFDLRNLPALDVTNLFDIINKFGQIRSIYLNLAKLIEIPALAFEPLITLNYLTINGTNIKKLKEKAFYNLNSLTYLEISSTSIDSIGANIFVFSRESQHTLTISLFNNQLLNCDSFKPETFNKAHRPLHLDFSGRSIRHRYKIDAFNRKQLTCMPEQVFRPFLNVEPGRHKDYNFVQLYDLDFDCSNCKSSWLKKETHFHDRILGFKCENGKNVTDKANFNGC